jgi:hypothetical protein
MDLKDAEVQEVISWFGHCYDVESGNGVASWKRTALPAAGGIGGQDARLINAMEYVAGVHQRVLEENWRRRQKAKKDDG